MFAGFFGALRDQGVPVSLREYLAFLEALRRGLAHGDVEAFYYLARAAMVKDERHIDRFDRAFAACFKGVEALPLATLLDRVELPAEWLAAHKERLFTAEERAEIEGLGGFEALMDALKRRLAEQEARHQGGSKWIGTAGTSPFGAYGYNPEGVRIGPAESRHRRAAKVWDRREFRNLDGTTELGTRTVKLALKRLRRWARDGAPEELDLDGTIRGTAERGYLDLRMRPERRNAVKVLLFLDVGGSMDPHIGLVEQLFSAARMEFKYLEYFYFHNCIYEGLWRDNRRRWTAQTPTEEVLRSFGPDCKAIFVGDAAMSPYEITHPGGANEHWNAIAGAEWLGRMRRRWPASIWINPLPQEEWRYTASIALISEIFEDRMFPMTLDGIGAATRELGR